MSQAQKLFAAEMHLSENGSALTLLKNLGIEKILDDENALYLYRLLNKSNPYHKPAGTPDGGQFTSADDAGSANTTDISNSSKVPDSWGNPSTFENHYAKHALDFNAASAEDYAQQASDFLDKAKTENLPMIEYPNGGEIGAFDPLTNTYGLYNADGTTMTFYKPTSSTYFERQIDDVVLRGGRVINPLSNISSDDSTLSEVPASGTLKPIIFENTGGSDGGASNSTSHFTIFPTEPDA